MLTRLLILLFLIPMTSFAGVLEPLFSEYFIADNQCPKGQYKFQNRCMDKRNYEINVLARCSNIAAQANNDFAAKKLYKNCLDRWGVKDK